MITVLNFKCRSVFVCVCVLWSASRLKVRSKATVLDGGEGHHYLWVADMREKWNPLMDPNDVFFRSEKSKHVHCLVMWPTERSQSGHCRKGLCFNNWSLKQHICRAKLKRCVDGSVGWQMRETPGALSGCRLWKNGQIRDHRAGDKKKKKVSKFSALHSVSGWREELGRHQIII